MNIFVLDNNPIKAAEYLCDKHVVKMALETAQLLSTVAQLRGYEAPYKMTHKNHPATQWVLQSPANWQWLIEHGNAICQEYTLRYNKVHKSSYVINEIEKSSNIIWGSLSDSDHHMDFVQCMPEQYKRINAVDAYRAYYIGDKSSFAKWKAPRDIPAWFK